MKTLRVLEIVQATGGKLLSGNAEASIVQITTDSRNVPGGSLFIPIKGEKFDGHDFLEMAAKSGAKAVLTEKTVTLSRDVCVILVEDTLRAMQSLASYYRDLFPVHMVGITGSVGKTSTKEMTAAVLERKFKTLKTEGNFNNEIGLPLTVFRMEEGIEAAVLEMGMSGFGEIDRLAAIAKPEIGIVTNIGMSHIELLGSQENIYRAKSEMFAHIKPGGTVVLNGDDPILKNHKDEIPYRVITVGKSEACDVVAKNITSDEEGINFDFSGFGRDFRVRVNRPGEHNVYNALFAIATGFVLGVPEKEILLALKELKATKMRMDYIRHNGYTIINDCYNAAPDSMNAALSVLGKTKGKKIAVLGDMACMGEFSKTAHKLVGETVASEGVDMLFTIGKEAKEIALAALSLGLMPEQVKSAEDVSEIYEALRESIVPDCHVLVKASRVMELERVTEFLQKEC
ncbi:MAG: UDP-N-acetylmuramoyl-tripeptide--D-alanyl-D-alanine ligase [Clostridia bacterium]|nr:UDP-N-acetylmuramoyl-tripeptide--D-alanyl-D-alanine ligase [Clostridia bacterium]